MKIFEGMIKDIIQKGLCDVPYTVFQDLFNHMDPSKCLFMGNVANIILNKYEFY